MNARSTYTPPSAVADILRHSNSASAQTISAKFQALNKKVTQIMKANQGTAQQVGQR